MSTILCSIVSAEKEIFSEDVSMVVATGTMGELGKYFFFGADNAA
jgi:F0F1-type ATP synthase epsilon subunit